MANITTNFNLIKPIGTDAPDIANINANMDIIDNQLKVAQDQFDAQTIGGTNLLTGSKDFSGAWANSDKWTTEADKYRGFTVKKVSEPWTGLSQSTSLPNNTTIVYSFYAKTDNPSASHMVYATDSAHVNEFNKTYEIVKLTTEWARYEVTFASKVDNAHAYIRLVTAANDVDAYICAPCLQYGDKATEWLPAESSIYIASATTSIVVGAGSRVFDDKTIPIPDGYTPTGIACVHSTDGSTSTHFRYVTSAGVVYVEIENHNSMTPITLSWTGYILCIKSH